MKKMEIVQTSLLALVILAVLAFVAEPGLYAAIAPLLPYPVRLAVSLAIWGSVLLIVVGTITGIFQRIFGRTTR